LNTLIQLSVHPHIPERLSRLRELAYNLWWSWNPPAQELFRRLDPDLWEAVDRNPVKLLLQVSQHRLDQAAADPKYLTAYDRILKQFDTYMDAPHTWASEFCPEINSCRIAYFSAEFGLHEALPIYSGGLGILSGDHCKAASDLGLPLVGVGFLYPQGYFCQRITLDGQQEAIYEKLDFSQVPAKPARTAEGQDIVVQVNLPGRPIYAKVWHIQIGRVPLFLMDTDVDPNAPEDRVLAARLYGGDHEMRISQEFVLGIGGVRVLRALGVQPKVWHLNEGHAAFVVLERIRELVEEQGLTFDEARHIVASSTLFTTHTPVSAGHDVFDIPLVEKYFADFWPRLSVNRRQFLELGHQEQPWGRGFSMTVLALKLSRHHNAVSRLHGTVSRQLWHFLWHDLPVSEVPIESVTNGIHSETWLAPELAPILSGHLGADWVERIDDPTLWEGIAAIPDETLWEVRRQLRQKMVRFLRRRERARRKRLNESPARVQAADSLLDPHALTIGFARRFATYKRPTLLLLDRERLHRLLTNPERPVQIIFAGKAHPADEPGKALIREIFELSQDPDFANHVLLVEDYDMNVARHLVQGVDLWLNTPRRPLEASGTSGQKAGLNGVVNFSVLDGWWAEGFDGTNGWPIGRGEQYDNPDAQDEADALSLYYHLERDIIPLFYQRDEQGVPRKWLQWVRRSMQTIAPQFSTRRMVKDYASCFYKPAATQYTQLCDDDFSLARELAMWEAKVREAWQQVTLEAQVPQDDNVVVGEPVSVSARLTLPGLDPTDVLVEAVAIRNQDRPEETVDTVALDLVRNEGDDTFVYAGQYIPADSGLLTLGVRVSPHHPLVRKHALRLVRWASPPG